MFPPWKGHKPCLDQLCIQSLAELLNSQRLQLSEGWHQWPTGTSHSSVCLCSAQPWLCTRTSHPFLQLRKLRLKKETCPRSRSEARITVHGVLGTQKAGRGLGRWFWSKEERRTTHGCFPHSCQPANQAVCKSSGLKLPTEKAKRSQPERVHSKRHGCGESISPPATSLAEDLAL